MNGTATGINETVLWVTNLTYLAQNIEKGALF
jgi:hypothetical protein